MLLLRIVFITICKKYVKRVSSIFRSFRFSVSRECRHCREANSSFDFRVRLRTAGLHLASNATGPVMSCIFRLISSLTISEKVMKRFFFCLTMNDEHDGHFGKTLGNNSLPRVVYNVAMQATICDEQLLSTACQFSPSTVEDRNRKKRTSYDRNQPKKRKGKVLHSQLVSFRWTR